MPPHGDRQVTDGAARRGDLFDPLCPTRVVLDRIGDKWTSMAIKSLAEQAPNELRFSEMQRALVGISAKVLSQTLRNLEHDGLVERRIEATRPPSVYYSLTALGLSLDGPLAAVREWAEANVARIEAAHAQSGSA